MDESDYRVGKDASPFDDFNEAEAVAEPVRRSSPKTIAASLAGLLLLIAFHAMQTSQWVRHDTRPPAWDQSVQLETAWDLKEALAKGDIAGAMRMRPKPGMPPFPLLYHLSIQRAMTAPDPVAVALWVNWAYLALLCVALWGLGRHFLGEWEGLGAAILFTCVPEMGWLQREVLVDIPLTAWVACAYWALAASDGFRKKVPSVLFGACFGAAMMTKWSAFSFFLPAVIPFWAALTGFGKAAPLLSAAVAAAICLPWYAAQAPILVPRLFEAAADQAVPVWKGGAAFTYFFLMGSGLELPLLVLGVGGAFVPTAKRRNEDHWILVAWFLTSLVFWTIVPNRQLRYLLPGLVPLGVLAMGPWPRNLSIAACALSLLMAWNYPRGVLPPLGVGGVPVSLFRSDKPVKEAWPLADILRAASEMRDTSLPFANLAFVANHPRFNGPVLNWERKRLGLDGLRIRGVTKRYTELCEFVAVKSGDLGPASVTGQLPEVQKVMLDPGRWFGRGWKEVRTFPFPDGTQAVLFQRRKLKAPPIAPGKVTVAYYEEGHFKAEGMVLDFGPWDAERGVYKTIEVKADSIGIRGLQVDGVDLRLEGVAFFNADETDAAKSDPLSDPRFTRIDAVSLRRATVRAESLAAFLEDRVRGLTEVSATIDGGTVSASGKLKGKAVSASLSAALLPGGKGIEAKPLSASALGIPLPARFFGGLTLPFEPTSELPFRISMPSLTLEGGRLKVGG